MDLNVLVNWTQRTNERAKSNKNEIYDNELEN